MFARVLRGTKVNSRFARLAKCDQTFISPFVDQIRLGQVRLGWRAGRALVMGWVDNPRCHHRGTFFARFTVILYFRDGFP